MSLWNTVIILTFSGIISIVVTYVINSGFRRVISDIKKFFSFVKIKSKNNTASRYQEISNYLDGVYDELKSIPNIIEKRIGIEDRKTSAGHIEKGFIYVSYQPLSSSPV